MSFMKHLIQKVATHRLNENAYYQAHQGVNHDEHVNHPDPDVRKAVAENGTDAHRDKLVNDSDAGVRKAVALHGNSSHHAVLKHDVDHEVRRVVASHGGEHTEALKNDPHPDVSHMAHFSSN